MMRKTTVLLALCLGSMAAVAQNVIVVMKDGTTRKYNADYIKEMSFREVAPEKPAIPLDKVEVTPFSGGNVTLLLSDSKTKTEFKLDLYGPRNEPWLHAGTYVYATNNEPYTMDPVYSGLNLDGVVQKFNDAKVEVYEEDELYSITATFVLDDNSEIVGKWEGSLPLYTRTLRADMSGASYLANAQPAGNFYVKLNDADYNYEMALVFVADADATLLPAGTYTYSTSDSAGSLAPKSYVDCFKPNANLKLKEGSKATVSVEDKIYTIEMALNLSDGRIALFNYTGEIKGTPSFD